MRAKEKSAQKTLRVTGERIGVSREMCFIDLISSEQFSILFIIVIITTIFIRKRLKTG